MHTIEFSLTGKTISNLVQETNLIKNSQYISKNNTHTRFKKQRKNPVTVKEINHGGGL